MTNFESKTGKKFKNSTKMYKIAKYAKLNFNSSSPCPETHVKLTLLCLGQ